jgi:predicted GTPase
LIVGRTGNGKSTVANVLSNTNNFSESSSSVSATKETQSEIFEWKGVNYRVVDTIGFSDTKLSRDIFIHKIAKSIDQMPEGINQILFVIGNRFTNEEIEALETLKNDILEESIKDYITIIKPRFDNFRKEEKCKEDIQQMLKNGGNLAELILSCQERVIHVNNPSLDVDISDDEEQESTIILNKKARNKSREKLLDYLDSKCQNTYKVRT